jgi:hypothetical protein
MDLGTILSGPVGAIFGALGALGGKYLDLKLQKQANDHALAMRDKDMAQVRVENELKVDITKMDADSKIQLKDFDTMVASYVQDKASYGDSFFGRIVDGARGTIRPLITFLAMLLVGYMTMKVLRMGDPLSTSERMDILRESLFLSGTAITWWFGARPSQTRRS